MIYGIHDRPPIGKLALFSVQMLLSVVVATILIANICQVPVSGALVGAGLSTLIYILCTRGQSPMFISNSGAFVAPVMTALAMGGYTAVAIGGMVSCIVYCAFGLVFSRIPVDNIYKVFPKALIGSVTMVIGITLMKFILTYVQINGVTNVWGIVIAFITMFSIAIISHYSQGILRILPFLIGTIIGYGCAVVLTITGIYPIVDFSVFTNLTLFSMPDFAHNHWTSIDLATIVPVIVIYIAYTVSAMMEALSDHASLGNIIGVDLYEKPGLSRIFFAEGIANVVGSSFGALGQCSYGESIACVGFSKVASVWVTAGSAIMLILLGFIAPVQAFIASIPSCVFAGSACILYGFIACSGVKMLQDVDLNVQKNLIITSIVLSLGISGLAIGNATFAISGTALALIIGIILNIVLKE